MFRENAGRKTWTEVWLIGTQDSLGHGPSQSSFQAIITKKQERRSTKDPSLGKDKAIVSGIWNP